MKHITRYIIMALFIAGSIVPMQAQFVPTKVEEPEVYLPLGESSLEQRRSNALPVPQVGTPTSSPTVSYSGGAYQTYTDNYMVASHGGSAQGSTGGNQSYQAGEMSISGGGHMPISISVRMLNKKHRGQNSHSFAEADDLLTATDEEATVVKRNISRPDGNPMGGVNTPIGDALVPLLLALLMYTAVVYQRRRKETLQ